MKLHLFFSLMRNSNCISISISCWMAVLSIDSWCMFSSLFYKIAKCL